jgi:hypothetical protein
MTTKAVNLCQDYVVLRSTIEFDDGSDVVPGGAESGDDGEVAALVGEKLHRLFPVVRGILTDEDNFFVGERVGGIAHRRVDVFSLQLRISFEQVCLGRTLAKFAKEQFDRNPRSSDDRFAEHDTRINFDSIGERHCASR